MFFRASILTRALFAASNTAFTVSKAAMAGSMHITLLFSHRIESGIYAVWWAGWAILKKLRDRNTEIMQKFCKFRNLMHEPEMRLARSPILPQSSADEWCNSQRAHPEALARAIYFCSKYYTDQNDANLCNAHSAVQFLCTTFTPLEATDPWPTMGSAFRQHLGWQKY